MMYKQLLQVGTLAALFTGSLATNKGLEVDKSGSRNGRDIFSRLIKEWKDLDHQGPRRRPTNSNSECSSSSESQSSVDPIHAALYGEEELSKTQKQVLIWNDSCDALRDMYMGKAATDVLRCKLIGKKAEAMKLMCAANQESSGWRIGLAYQITHAGDKYVPCSKEGEHLEFWWKQMLKANPRFYEWNYPGRKDGPGRIPSTEMIKMKLEAEMFLKLAEDVPSMQKLLLRYIRVPDPSLSAMPFKLMLAELIRKLWCSNEVMHARYIKRAERVALFGTCPNKPMKEWVEDLAKLLMIGDLLRGQL